MKRLTLPVKGVYFRQIQSGEKDEEYRLHNVFWRRRIEGKVFDEIVLTLGYPKKTDISRRITRPWRGYEIKTITHEHFSKKPVKVFAIKVN